MDLANALTLFANFVLVPSAAYGAQLALGALGVTLIFGIWLGIEGAWEFSDLFVTIGYVMLLAGFAIGIGFLTPKGKALGALVDEQGEDSPEAFELAKKLSMADHALAGLLLIAMIAIIFKF